eukprot:3239782-Rhodomonas_salina.1
MSILERQLQADLHTLKLDAGKKFPKLKDAAERADRDQCFAKLCAPVHADNAAPACVLRKLLFGIVGVGCDYDWTDRHPIRHLREVSEGGVENDEAFAAILRDAHEMLSPGILAIETRNA